MNTVKIGNKIIGGENTYIIAEIGINHNGFLDNTFKLIDIAVETGCDAVKFQKRDIPTVFSEKELAKPREVPKEVMWNALLRGVLPEKAVSRLTADIENTTYGDVKYALEFTKEEFSKIFNYCNERGIHCFASCWDEASVDLIDKFNPPCHKIASASLTDKNLLLHIRSKGRPVILSTAMSSMEQIDKAVEILGRNDLVIMHCVGVYPAKNEDLNLMMVKTLQEKYPDVPIGYSGHEIGLYPSVFAVVLGACMVERHITLDRSMWGSDQSASVERPGFALLRREVELWKAAKGDGVKHILEKEVEVMKKLRRKDTLFDPEYIREEEESYGQGTGDIIELAGAMA